MRIWRDYYLSAINRSALSDLLESGNMTRRFTIRAILFNDVTGDVVVGRDAHDRTFAVPVCDVVEANLSVRPTVDR
jgi:hypothetical protein